MPNQHCRIIRWAEELLGTPVHVSALVGGANNHLFRCQGSSGELVIKRYRQQNFGADVSRRTAEVTLLKHAAFAAPQFIPKLLAEHTNDEMIAMTLVAGEPYRESGEISQSDIKSAIEFYRRLNDDRDAVARYPIAAREGYRSISDHIKHVEQRLLRLSTDHLPKDLQRRARYALDFVSQSFLSVRASLERQIVAGDLVDSIPNECLQISPGDFGFHNAIRSKSGPIFIDYEYAGLDDPAKTLSDFFLQPKIPISGNLFNQIAKGLSQNLRTDSLVSRAKALSAILSVKWKGIILAPLDMERFPSFQVRYGDEMREELVRRIEFVTEKPRSSDLWLM